MRIEIDLKQRDMWMGRWVGWIGLEGMQLSMRLGEWVGVDWIRRDAAN
jgi:hypothetical protein